MNLYPSIKLLTAATLGGWLLTPHAAVKTVLDFEDEEFAPVTNRQTLRSDYAGLKWTGWAVEAYGAFLLNEQARNSVNPGKGNARGLSNYINTEDGTTVSPEVSSLKLFRLESVHLFSFPVDNKPFDTNGGKWSSAQKVTLTGYRAGGTVAEKTVELFNSGAAPTELIFVDPQWNAVDRVVFTAMAGPAAANPPRFEMDNLAITIVPLPPPLLLLGTSLGVLAAAGRRQNRRRHYTAL